MLPPRPVPPAPAGCADLDRAAALLVEAADFAADLGCDPWDFAVEIDALRQAGLTNSALRWLVAREYVRHAQEVVNPPNGSRAFRPAAGLVFTPATCFILTDRGLSYTRTREADRPGPPPAPGPADPAAGLPVWDADRQELRVGRVVVKCFRVPAPNQEVILAAFQEEGWPVRIDDPLSPQAGLDAKRRLHETITSLNRNRRQKLISFHGDGRGQGVRWEPGAGGPAADCHQTASRRARSGRGS